MGKINFDNQTEPVDVPNSGKTFLYVDELDLHIKTKDDTGLVIDLTKTRLENNKTQEQLNFANQDGGVK